MENRKPLTDEQEDRRAGEIADAFVESVEKLIKDRDDEDAIEIVDFFFIRLEQVIGWRPSEGLKNTIRRYILSRSSRGAVHYRL